jgi:hypothetical protein
MNIMTDSNRPPGFIGMPKLKEKFIIPTDGLLAMRYEEAEWNLHRPEIKLHNKTDKRPLM